MLKVAVLLYLFHPEKWDEIKSLLLPLKEKIDLFLAVCTEVDSLDVVKDCKDNFTVKKVLHTQNKGLDLGPFLLQLNELNSKKYPYFLKLHTKRSVIGETFIWTDCLLNSTIGSVDVFDENIKQLQQSKNTSVICDSNFIIKNYERTHVKQIQNLCKILNIPYSNVQLGRFMAGGIFLGKTGHFKYVFNKHIIQKIYSLLEKEHLGLTQTSSYVHALECVMGYINTYYKQNIKSCYVNSLRLFNKQLNKDLTLIKTFKDTCYIQENPLMHGAITHQKDDTLFIVWSHCNENVYKYTKIDEVYVRIDDIPNTTFNVNEYRELNPDILHLSDIEAQEHYNIHGRREGRSKEKNEIQIAFDSQYYSQEYGIQEDQAFNNYIEKGRFEGRLFSPLILKYQFDYGYYISLKNHTKQDCYNMYDSFNSFLQTQSNNNNIIKQTKKEKLKSTCCIYIAELNTHKDVYNVLRDLSELKLVCKKVVLILSNTHKALKADFIIQKNKNDYMWYFKALDSVLQEIDLIYSNYIILTNKTTIINSVENTFKTLQNSNRDVLSLTDCYKQHPYTGEPTYHLQTDLLFLRKNNIQYLQEFLVNYIKDQPNTLFAEKVFEYELTAFLLQKNITIGSLLTPTHELEFFWKDLFTLSLNRQPNILHKYQIPIVHKDLLVYFTQLIEPKFIKQKNTFRLNSWFKQQIIKTNNKVKTAVVLHVFNEKHINEFEELIKTNLDKFFYITGNHKVYQALKHLTNNIKYIKTENKGMDIGPFLKTMLYLKEHNIKYDYIIKLQDKATTSWRKYCFTNLIENYSHYTRLLHNNDTSIGGPYSLLLQLDKTNFETLKDFFIRNNIKLNLEVEFETNAFIAGTMFIMKHACFNDFVDKHKIDLNYEYNMLEDGKVTNLYATNTHAWERVLTCIMPTAMKTKLKCI